MNQKPKSSNRKKLTPSELHDSMTREEVEAMLTKAGTKYSYWVHIKNQRKRPCVDLARALVEASGDRLDINALLIPREKIRKTGSAPIGGGK